jgi:hypothetical protein
MTTKDLNARRNGILVPLTYGRSNFDFIFSNLAPYCNDPTLIISVYIRCGKLNYGQFSNIMASVILTIRFLGSKKTSIAKQVRILCVVQCSLFSWRPLSL